MNKHRELPEIAVYFIQSEPRQESCTGEHLARQGFEYFDPDIRIEKLHAGHMEQQKQPMFSPFIKIKAQDGWRAIHSAHGASRVAGFCDQTCPADDSINAELASNPLATDEAERVALLLHSLNGTQVVSRPMAGMTNRTDAHFATF